MDPSIKIKDMTTSEREEVYESLKGTRTTDFIYDDWTVDVVNTFVSKLKELNDELFNKYHFMIKDYLYHGDVIDYVTKIYSTGTIHDDLRLPDGGGLSVIIDLLVDENRDQLEGVKIPLYDYDFSDYVNVEVVVYDNNDYYIDTVIDCTYSEFIDKLVIGHKLLDDTLDLLQDNQIEADSNTIARFYNQLQRKIEQKLDNIAYGFDKFVDLAVEQNILLEDDVFDIDSTDFDNWFVRKYGDKTFEWIMNYHGLFA